MELGASGAGAVDVDNAGTDKELRRQPYVSPGREVCLTAFPDPERRPRR